MTKPIYTLKRIPSDYRLRDGKFGTAYAVQLDGRTVGRVWQVKTHTKDFYPTRWRAGFGSIRWPEVLNFKLESRTRQVAVKLVLRRLGIGLEDASNE